MDRSNRQLTALEIKALEYRRQLVVQMKLFTAEGLACIVAPSRELRQASLEGVTERARVKGETPGARSVSLADLASSLR